MAVFSAKIPVALATGIVCFVLGGGIVGLVLSYTMAKPDAPAPAAPTAAEEDDEPKESRKEGSKGGPPGGGAGKGGKGAGGGGKGGGAPGGGGGAKGPSAKAQLAQLVTKLDTLTQKPLTVALTPDQKKQAQELLAGLDAAEELKEEDAKAKLDALLKLVEGSKETLEAAGYRWPGGGGGGFGGGAPPPNPFKEGEGANRLKSLQSTLGK